MTWSYAPVRRWQILHRGIDFWLLRVLPHASKQENRDDSAYRAGSDDMLIDVIGRLMVEHGDDGNTSGRLWS